jgi:hypothetical protein
MSKSAQSSKAFTFVVERLPVKEAIVSSHADHWQTATQSARKGLSQAGRGCLVLTVVIVAVAFLIAYAA